MAFDDFFPDLIKTALEKLIHIPTYGERGANRFFYNLMKLDRDRRHEILQSLLLASESLKVCSECGLLSDTDPCRVCSSPIRDRKILCVVEETQDAYAIERTERYNGLYHVLGGRIAPLEGISPQDLNIETLVNRVEKLKLREVILATNPNVEGEATASYIARLLRRSFPKLQVSRIAYGAQLGAFLEFMDEASLQSSLENRKQA